MHMRMGYVPDDAAALCEVPYDAVLRAAGTDTELASAIGGVDPFSFEGRRLGLQARVLKHLAVGMRVTDAARAAGTTEAMVYHMTKENPSFAAAYQATRHLAKASSRTVRTKFTPRRTSDFLQRLREGASILSAAESVGISEGTVYVRRGRDPQFAHAMDLARKVGGTDPDNVR